MSNMNAEAEQFQICLVRLALLMAQGQGNSKEADDLREMGACLELRLDDNIRAFMGNLSSDLYMIEDTAIYDDPDPDYPSPELLRQAIYTVYQSRNWDRLLTLLRQEAPFLRQEIRAYLRGRAYERLGFYAAAWVFFTDAARRNENRTEYALFSLSNLFKWDREAATRQAEQYISNASVHPVLRILAANEMVSAYRETIEQHRFEDDDKNRIRQALLVAA